MLQRLENNCCLSELINRECTYKYKTYYDDDDNPDNVILDEKTTTLRAAKAL